MLWDGPLGTGESCQRRLPGILGAYAGFSCPHRAGKMRGFEPGTTVSLSRLAAFRTTPSAFIAKEPH